MKHLRTLFLVVVVSCAVDCERDANPLSPPNPPPSQSSIDWEGNYPQVNTGTQNEILFSSDRFLNTSFAPSVHVTDVSDKNVHGLLNFYFTSGASWSPRRWKVIFEADTGWYKSVPCLFIANYDGTGIKQISPKGEQVVGIAAWSPDGETIAYLEMDTTNRVFARVKLMKPDGSQARAITGWYGQLTRVTWSPDSKRLVFGGCEVGSSDVLYIIEADGTNLKILLGLNMVGAYSPSWSPDGQFIAFSSLSYHDSAYYSNIFTYNVISQQTTQITRTKSDDFTATWSADSKYLVFDSDPADGLDNSRLRMVAVDGTGNVALTDSLAIDYQPCWYK